MGKQSAKTSPTGKVGAKTKTQRKAELEKIIQKSGIAQAQEILATYSVDVIKYAHLIIPEPDQKVSKAATKLLGLDLGKLSDGMKKQLLDKLSE